MACTFVWSKRHENSKKSCSMNINVRLFLFSAILAVTSTMNSAHAQVSATAEIGATIVTPTTLSKESDLEVEVGSATTGRLNERRNSFLGTAVKSISSAIIKISGNPEYTYSVTIPPYVTIAAKDKTVNIGTELNANAGSNTLSKDGIGAFTIKGTLAANAKTTAPMIAMIADEDEEPIYVHNGIPVIVNNN